MRGERKGNATVKARGQGGGGRGQRGKGAQPSQKRKRALAQNTPTDKDTTLKTPRLFPFAPFGEVCDPVAPCPDPLPPASLLFRLHPFASPCIGFSPFASACIRLHPPNLPFRVGGSGGRVGVSGRGSGCRVGVSGRVGSVALPLPLLPHDARRQRKQGIENPAFFLTCSQSTYTNCNSNRTSLPASYTSQFHP